MTPDDDLQTYITRLSEVAFVQAVKVLRTASAASDAQLEIRAPSGRFTMRVDQKRSHLSKADVARTRAADDWLLLAPHIGAPLGALLEKRGVNFLDRSGNCYLRLGDHHIARVQGRARNPPPASDKAMRAAGYRVLFTLLADPKRINDSLRTIAAAANTSVNPVSDVLDRLAADGVVTKTRQGERVWTDRPRTPLLDQWVAGYQTTIATKLGHGRFRLREAGPRAVEQRVAERIGGVRFGGTAGAYRLVGHYRGPDTLIHVAPSETHRRKLGALRADDGELVWLAPLCDAASAGVTHDTVHPLLIYAELLADPDPRSREVAELVRNEHLPWSL